MRVSTGTCATLAAAAATYMGGNMLNCAFTNTTGRDTAEEKHGEQCLKKNASCTTLCENKKECPLSSKLCSDSNDAEQCLVTNPSHTKPTDLKHKTNRKKGIWKRHFNHTEPSIERVNTSIISTLEHGLPCRKDLCLNIKCSL